MRSILSVKNPDGSKTNSFVDPANLPAVAKECSAEIIGKGGAILATKEEGAESFITNEV